MATPQDPNEILISAFLDGELSPEESARVDRLLEDPRHQDLLNDWKLNRESIQSLPPFSLGDDFAAKVMEEIEGQKVEIANHVAASSASDHWSLISITSLAAMLVITLFVFPNFQLSEKAVAEADNKELEKEQQAAVLVQHEHGMLYSSKTNDKAEALKLSEAIQLARPSTGLNRVIRLRTDLELSDLKSVLTQSGIQFDESAFASADKAAMIHVTATPREIRETLTELMNGYVDSLEQVEIPVTGNKSMMLPLEADKISSDVDMAEVSKVDQWFGLDSPEAGKNRVSCLFLFEFDK